MVKKRAILVRHSRLIPTLTSVILFLFREAALAINQSSQLMHTVNRQPTAPLKRLSDLFGLVVNMGSYRSAVANACTPNSDGLLHSVV